MRQCPLMTHSGSRAPEFAVAHNAPRCCVSLCTLASGGGAACADENRLPFARAPLRHGRASCARSSASTCGASVYCCRQPRTMRYGRIVSGHSCRGSAYWAGPLAATCTSTPVGPRPMPPKFADTPPKWLRLRLAIPAAATSSVVPLLQATRTVPIIFTATNDPVGAGFVDSLARPGGNATGFMNWEFSIGAKWLELLKQTAPGVTRVAVLRDASQGFTI